MLNINIELSMERTEEELENEWRTINWIDVKRYVDRMQGKIFLATKNRNFKKLKNLQELARRSFYFHLHALKQITMINQGKYTPGIDGKLCVSILDRYIILKRMKKFNPKTYKPLPIKRVNIPKPNGGIRPLGIPVIYDRCIQMLYKLFLEPEFEQKFHKNSFGFRPGRCPQDAVELIKKNLYKGYNVYILDADIKGFFDNINHNLILRHFQPHHQDMIRKWLTAKIVKDNYCIKPIKGTPQGGVISPLLANIALTEFDFRYNPNPSLKVKDIRRQIITVRYADDFVVISKSKSVLEHILKNMMHYFASIGLEFNASKTRIVERGEGFDFLGFRFIKYPKSYLKISPSKNSISKVKAKIKETLDSNKQAKTDAIIYRLNQIVRGWAIYYRYCNAAKSFYLLNFVVFRWIWRWCTRRHPQKGKRWVRQKYYKTDLTSRWIFHGEMWSSLLFSDIPRKKYAWVVGDMSLMNPKYNDEWARKPETTNQSQVVS